RHVKRGDVEEDAHEHVRERVEDEAAERGEEAKAGEKDQEYEGDLEADREERSNLREHGMLVEAEEWRPVAVLEPLRVHLEAEVVAEDPVEARGPEFPEAGKEVEEAHQEPNKAERERIGHGRPGRCRLPFVCATPRVADGVDGERVPARTDGQDGGERHEVVIVVHFSIELRDAEDVDGQQSGEPGGRAAEEPYERREAADAEYRRGGRRGGGVDGNVRQQPADAERRKTELRRDLAEPRDVLDVDAAKQDREEYDAEDRQVDGRARGGEEGRDGASGLLPQKSCDHDRLHA